LDLWNINKFISIQLIIGEEEGKQKEESGLCAAVS
jgi:hypothetical protein